MSERPYIGERHLISIQWRFVLVLPLSHFQVTWQHKFKAGLPHPLRRHGRLNTPKASLLLLVSCATGSCICTFRHPGRRPRPASCCRSSADWSTADSSLLCGPAFWLCRYAHFRTFQSAWSMLRLDLAFPSLRARCYCWPRCPGKFVSPARAISAPLSDRQSTNTWNSALRASSGLVHALWLFDHTARQQGMWWEWDMRAQQAEGLVQGMWREWDMQGQQAEGPGQGMWWEWDMRAQQAEGPVECGGSAKCKHGRRRSRCREF